MDVNSAEWSQKEFKNMSIFCPYKDSDLCKKTTFACKDYICHIVKNAKNIAEVRKGFENERI